MQSSVLAAQECGELEKADAVLDLAAIPKDTTDGEPRCVLCGRGGDCLPPRLTHQAWTEADSELGPIELFEGHRLHRKCIYWSSEV